MSHTPGPWIVESVAAYGDTVAVTREGLRSKIAVTHESWICDEHGGTVAANAALIAAAPELLAALEVFSSLFLYPDDLGSEMARIMRDDMDWNENQNDEQRVEVFIARKHIRQARAAIAKAKGG